MHPRRSAPAALAAAAVLVAAGCGGSGDGTATTAATTTAAAPTTTDAATTTTSATTAAETATTTDDARERIELEIEGGRVNGGGPARVTVEQGARVTLRVTADVADEVHLHGYDLSAEVAPGAPATIRFTASAPGRFEAELEHAGREILQLQVEP